MSMAMVPPLSIVSIVFGAEGDTTHLWVGSTSQTSYLPAMPIEQAGYAELMMYGETDPWPVQRSQARNSVMGGEMREHRASAA